MVISDRQMGHPQLAAKSGALSCRLMHSCSAMDRHATRGVPYYRVSRIFMSRIFSVPVSACVLPREVLECWVQNFPLQNADGLQTHLAPLVILALQIRIVLTIVGIHKLYNLLTYCSILFFSCPRSEGWLHHWRTFFHLSLSCHTDWLFDGESCPRLDVVHPGRAWPSSPACTWHCFLHYLFLQLHCYLLLTASTLLQNPISSRHLYTPMFTHGLNNLHMHSIQSRRCAVAVAAAAAAEWRHGMRMCIKS